MAKPRKKHHRPGVSDALRSNVHQESDAPPARSRRPRPINMDKARLLAAEYCLFHYPTLYTGGVPRRCPPPHEQDWAVPIVLASPSHGVMGEVGEVRIDGRTGEVVAATDGSQVVASGEQLYKGRNDAPAASPLRPRKR